MKKTFNFTPRSRNGNAFTNPQTISVDNCIAAFTNNIPTSFTRSTTTATAVTKNPHFLVTGDVVVTTGLAPFALTPATVTVVDSFTYTFTVSNSGATSDPNGGTQVVTMDVNEFAGQFNQPTIYQINCASTGTIADLYLLAPSGSCTYGTLAKTGSATSITPVAQRLTRLVFVNKIAELKSYDDPSFYQVATTLARSSTTVTATVASTALLNVGDFVTIAGASTSSLNGQFAIASIPSSTTFTYTSGTSGTVASDSGTATLNYTYVSYDRNGAYDRTWYFQEPYSNSSNLVTTITSRANPLKTYTSASLTTAAGATASVAISDTNLVAGQYAVGAIVTGGSYTTGTPVVTKCVITAGTATFTIQNIHASAALNGTVSITCTIEQ